MTEGQVKDPAIPVQAVPMKLLDLRLKGATAIIQSVAGEFTQAGQHEFVCLKAGGTIEVFRIVVLQEDDEESTTTTTLKLVLRVETKSVLRSVAVVRYPGEKRDVVAIGSDSGAIAVLDFQNAQCQILHSVVYGKTGCRRSTPGQYMASDPKGRAVMISAIEKNKLVYVLNRDTEGNPTIASPLEANRVRTLIFATVGLDNGFENPIFATIETQYPEIEDMSTETPCAVDKHLTYYELDLGLNTMTRRWSAKVLPSACCLAAVPGGSDGPGGVLVGGEDWIEYRHESLKNRIACPIPRRKHHPANAGLLVQSIVVHRQKKNKFFALAQSEVGDVYKVTLDVKDSTVTGIEVCLLDTLPVANSLNISKLGMLFCASEFGEHYLYQFDRIDIPDAPSNASPESLQEDEMVTKKASELAKTFEPGKLQNLRKVFTIENHSPTTDILIGELAGNEVSPQIYTLAGRGPHSTMNIMRHGAAVTELAVSDLPGVPGGIFTIADNTAGAEGRNDKYIVVSFADATLVLSIGETVEEVGGESGFLTDSPTLACSALGNDGALCQVHPVGVRHIHKGQVKQWHCPGLKRIEYASANESQVIVALAGGELIYFELDPMSGNLTESKKKDMGTDVCCIDVGMIQKGSSRSFFAAVGCRDLTVRIISLDPSSLLVQKSSTALKSRPHSVSLQPMRSEEEVGVSDITLTIGLDDGSSLRASVDSVVGSISTSPARRFLGARPVAVSSISLESSPSTLLLSSRPWICRRSTAGKHVMAPLSYAPLDHGCSFSSDAVQEGIVATAGKTLRILSVDSTGIESGGSEAFNTKNVKLRYTPRQMALLSATDGNKRKALLCVVESDLNEIGLEARKALGIDEFGKNSDASGNDEMEVDSDDEDKNEENNEDEDENEEDIRDTPIRGPVPAEPGRWGSCVRLLDPADSCKTVDTIELNRDEAAFCCATVRFHSKGGESLLAVGTITGMTIDPMKTKESHILLYRVIGGTKFQLLHRTIVEDGPVMSLSHFQGRLLVGVGKIARLYEMGKRQLLRKCELRGLPTFIKSIQTVGDRAFLGDLMRSIHILRYDVAANQLILVGSDPSPRPIVSQELLDWNTVAVGDKYGNISILRLPRDVDIGAVDVSGQRALWDSSRESETPRLEVLCQYHVGEVVTGMTRSALVAGGAESLIYTTVSGRVGALVPFTSRDDVEFYTDLQSELRVGVQRPTGRDPLSFRSYHAPAMHTIDGDLCEMFSSLRYEEQSKIAEKLDRDVNEIRKKLEDTRNSLL